MGAIEKCLDRGLVLTRDADEVYRDLVVRETEEARAELATLTEGNAQLGEAVAVKDAIIKTAIDMMRSAPEDILGRMPDTTTQQGWWLRDELIDKLCKALSTGSPL